ncbi:hypothetical protein DMX83_12105 [Cutibacterium acnes]|nr:hypothetical protein CGS48_12095 [Cutibacterium acnes]TLG57993.1 hypothetical protein FD536_12100 [Cutibacterium acnes]TNH45494.1 hypothetical protein DMX83_12105 [Cutibacterium acnes]
MAGGLGCSATACIERQLGDGKPSTRDDQDFPSLNMESKISGASAALMMRPLRGARRYCLSMVLLGVIIFASR